MNSQPPSFFCCSNHVHPGSFTHLEAVAFLPLPDHAQLPLGVAHVLPQSRQEQAALAASQEKRAGQPDEVFEGGGADSGRLKAELLVPMAELVSQQAEEFLDLGRRQHWFDKMGECPGVHLEEGRGGGTKGKPGFDVVV